jgi:hypothetical protein
VHEAINPMFSLIESKQEISKAQRKLEAAIRRDFKTTTIKNIGYPGGTTPHAKIFTDGNYWYWSSDHNDTDVSNPRRLNWFGLFRDDVDLQISVEINTAYEGRNDQVAGFFARDNDTGSTYLLHSGRVGGGTKALARPPSSHGVVSNQSPSLTHLAASERVYW